MNNDQQTDAIQILSEFAETEPIDYDIGQCPYCYSTERIYDEYDDFTLEHAATCPWLRARKLLQATSK